MCMWSPLTSGTLQEIFFRFIQPARDRYKAAGRQPNLAEYYSGWAEPFDTSFAEMLREHHMAAHRDPVPR
jgi:hypothetical protein